MNKILKKIDGINEKTGELAKWITYAFVALVCAEVFMRYVLNRPTIQLPVIVTMTTAAMYVLSLGYIFLHDGHVRIDVVTRLLSPRGRALMDVIFSVLFFFPVIGSLTIQGAWWTWFAWATGETDKQTFWYAPIAPIRTVVFIGLLLFLLQGISVFVKKFYFIVKGKELTYD
ncbi:MAG: TRAP transporter small permease subunit [Thermodesulfobacteriota bacterium]